MTAVQPIERVACITVGLLLCLFLIACAGSQTQHVIEAPPDDVQRSTELHDVPFYPQEKYQCGPAALATVLTHLGADVTDEDLVSEVYVPRREGSLQIEMRAATRSRGFIPYPLAPSLSDLIVEINAGRPVLVMQNLGVPWLPYWHYAVVVGYDLDAAEMVLRSETTERHITSMSSFERTWGLADYWAQVVVPPSDIPHTARPLEWVGATNEFEQMEKHHTAAKGYQSAVDRWPDFRPAWFALGNALYRDGSFESAETAFLKTVELDPQDWTGWNNLAHALAATEKPSCSKVAARCSASLAPASNRSAKSTLDKFGTFGGHGECDSLPRCPTD